MQSLPTLGQIAVAAVEQKQFQALIPRQVVGQHDAGVLAGHAQAGLSLHRPQGIRFGHCAHRLQRLRDDAVHQRIGPDAMLLQPHAKGLAQAPALRQANQQLAQHIAVVLHQLAGQKRQRFIRTLLPAAIQQHQQLGRKTLRHSAVNGQHGGAVCSVQRVARVARVGENDLSSQHRRTHLRPLRCGLQSAAYGLGLQGFIDVRAALAATHPHRIRLPACQRRHARRALRAGGGLHHGDTAQRVAATGVIG